MSYNTKQRLAVESKKKLNLPDEYLLLLKTCTQAIVVEGRKDFTEHNNRDASVVAWFEFLKGLSLIDGASRINNRYRLQYYSPLLVAPDKKYTGMIIRHKQDGSVSFGGRISNVAEVSSEATTIELIAYFQEIVQEVDDELRAHLQEYGVAIYEL